GVLTALLGSICQPRRSANALVCSSTAGRAVVEKQLEHLTRVGQLCDRARPFHCPVIPLGVDAEYFDGPAREGARQQLGIGAGEVAIASIGRFSSRTKADLRPLLIAFAELHRSGHRTVRLFLAGDDTQEHEARSLR